MNKHVEYYETNMWNTMKQTCGIRWNKQENWGTTCSSDIMPETMQCFVEKG